MGQTILQRVARQDAGAVRECINEYGGLVWSLARRFLSNPTDAEEAVQEIFVELWRSAGRYSPEVASETTFVAMIARRRLIDRTRRIGRSAPTADIASIPLESAPASDPDLGAEAARAAGALDELPPDQQRAIRLALVHGLSHQQIAESTGTPLGTVKTHIRRGLIRIRERLRAEGVEVPR